MKIPPTSNEEAEERIALLKLKMASTRIRDIEDIEELAALGEWEYRDKPDMLAQSREMYETNRVIHEKMQHALVEYCAAVTKNGNVN